MTAMQKKWAEQEKRFEQLEVADPLGPDSDKFEPFSKSIPDSRAAADNELCESEDLQQRQRERAIVEAVRDEKKHAFKAKYEEYRNAASKLGIVLDPNNPDEPLHKVVGFVKNTAGVVPGILDVLSDHYPTITKEDIVEWEGMKSTMLHNTRVSHHFWSKSLCADLGVSSPPAQLSQQEFAPVLERADVLDTMQMGTVPESWPESIKLVGGEMEVRGRSCTHLALLWYCRVMTDRKVTHFHLNAIIATLSWSPCDASFVLALLEASYQRLISSPYDFNMALCSVRCIDLFMKIEEVEAARKFESLRRAPWFQDAKDDFVAIAGLLADMGRSEATGAEGIRTEGSHRGVDLSYGVNHVIQLVADQGHLIVVRATTATIYPVANLRLEMTADSSCMIFKVKDDTGRQVDQIPVEAGNDSARYDWVSRHFPSLMGDLRGRTTERLHGILNRLRLQ